MEPPLARRPLGTTGLQVSAVSLGTSPFGTIDDEAAVAIFMEAVALGVNLVDTSPLYGAGESERRLGLALQAYFDGGGRREDLLVCTKTGTRTTPYDYSGEATRRSVDASLATLGLDYLDLVHIHDPDSLDEPLAAGGAVATLQQLRDEGLVRHTGLRVRSHDLHVEFHATGLCEASLTYRDYTLIDQSAAGRVLPSAQEHGVGILNAQVVRHGLLSGQDPEAVAASLSTLPAFQPGRIGAVERFEIDRAQRLRSWCRERDLDLNNLNVQFCLADDRVSSCLMGASSPEEVRANVGAGIGDVNSETWDALGQAFGIELGEDRGWRAASL